MTREAPVTLTLSPAAGALTAGTVGTAYSQGFTASGGSGNYTYAVTAGSLPDGLNLVTDGTLSGTPTTIESTSFTITATDVDVPANTGAAVYTLEIVAAPSLTLNPGDGSTLPEAMAGEDYSVTITATGATGAILYQTVGGALPGGMVLNVSTGEITGPSDADAHGTYSFTVQATDASEATGTATYTLVVSERTVTVTNHEVTVPEGGTPPNVDLTSGSTGGPFLDAVIVSVEPANAGAAQIVDTQYAQSGGTTPLQFYLKFTPNPSFSGQAHVNYQLVSSLGTSNVGTVTYNLRFDAAAVVSEIDGLVRGFVQTRQSLIASTIKVPGLLERRRMEAAMDPITARMSPSNDGLTLSFSSSLAQMNAASNAIDGIADAGTAISPFNIWIDGTFMVHNREQNGNRWGSFGMVSAGADYLITDNALVGLSFHYDRMTDPTDADAQLTGNGWLAGPYASFEIGNGVFWDTSLLYGGSSNTIDTAFWDGSFDTRRWLFDTSISGQWQLDEVTTLTPKLRAVYLSETEHDYSVENGSGDVLPIEGFTAEQLRVSLGAEIARQFTLEDGSTLTPMLGVTGGFSGLDGSGAFGSVSAGLSYQSPDAWTIDGGVLFNIEGDGQVSAGAKVGLGVRF